MVKVRDRFGGKVRFKGGLKCRGQQCNSRCNYRN